jgi:hypothetical protein
MRSDLMSTNPNEGMVKIRIPLDDGAETPWVTPMGGNRYRLENCPFFAFGMSFRDIIEAEPEEDGLLAFTRVVEKGGHRTVRVATADRSPVPEDLITKLNALGAWYEGADESYLVFDIPPDADFDAVIAELSACDEDAIHWEYVDPTWEELYPDAAAEEGEEDDGSLQRSE